QGEVAAQADVLAGLELRAALADEDAARRDDLAVEPLDAETLRVAVAAVLGAAYALLMSHLRPSSALDLGDAHLGVALPVPDVAPVVGLGPELVNVHLVAAPVADDLGRDLRALDEGRADLDIVAAEQKDGQFHRGARFGVKLLEPEHVTLGYAVLLTARFHDSEHLKNLRMWSRPNGPRRRRRSISQAAPAAQPQA